MLVCLERRNRSTRTSRAQARLLEKLCSRCQINSTLWPRQAAGFELATNRPLHRQWGGDISRPERSGRRRADAASERAHQKWQ